MGEAFRREALKAVIDATLKSFGKMAEGDGITKVTVSDFLRLMQYMDAAADEEPKEIRVTWVETPRTGSEPMN